MYIYIIYNKNSSKHIYIYIYTCVYIYIYIYTPHVLVAEPPHDVRGDDVLKQIVLLLLNH